MTNSRAYENLYKKLDTKEGENYIFKLAKSWSKKTQDIENGKKPISRKRMIVYHITSFGRV